MMWALGGWFWVFMAIRTHLEYSHHTNTPSFMMMVGIFLVLLMRKL